MTGIELLEKARNGEIKSGDTFISSDMATIEFKGEWFETFTGNRPTNWMTDDLSAEWIKLSEEGKREARKEIEHITNDCREKAIRGQEMDEYLGEL